MVSASALFVLGSASFDRLWVRLVFLKALAALVADEPRLPARLSTCSTARLPGTALNISQVAAANFNSGSFYLLAETRSISSISWLAWSLIRRSEIKAIKEKIQIGFWPS